MNDAPSAPPPPAGDKRSPVVPALLGVVAIMPELTLALLAPQMLALVRAGSMQALHLAEILALMTLVPVGIVLLFAWRRLALAAFVGAIVTGLAAVGSPFGRIALGDVIVAVIGATIIVLGMRRAG